MTQEDIIRLALAAGFEEPIEGWLGPAYIERLERFAALVAQHPYTSMEEVLADLKKEVQINDALLDELEAARRTVQRLEQALDNESLAHRDTRQRYEHLVQNMARHVSLFANPPVVIVKESDLETGMRVAMDKLGKQ